MPVKLARPAAASLRQKKMMSAVKAEAWSGCEGLLSEVKLGHQLSEIVKAAEAEWTTSVKKNLEMKRREIVQMLTRKRNGKRGTVRTGAMSAMK